MPSLKTDEFDDFLVEVGQTTETKRKRIARVKMPHFDMSEAEIIHKVIKKDGFYLKANPVGKLIGGQVKYGTGQITSDMVNRMGLEEIQLPTFDHWKQAWIPENHLEYIRKSNLIFRKGDKIVMTDFNRTHVKKCGNMYFEKLRTNKSITLNVKTGCFYVTTVKTNGNSQRGRQTRKNDFMHLGHSHGFEASDLQVFMDFIINEFDLQRNYTATEHLLSLKIEHAFKEVIIDWFLKVNSIKTTDNYRQTFKDYYPGLTLIKKNKGNLVEAICKKYKFKGKKIRKLLNTTEKVDVFKLTFLDSLLDIHVMNTIDDQVLKQFCFSAQEGDFRGGRNQFKIKRGLITYGEMFENYRKNPFLTISEQNKIVKLVSNGGFVVTDMIDHFSMRKEIERLTGQKVSMNFRNADEFEDEHRVYSKILNFIRKPPEKEIYYPAEMLAVLEKPIKLNDESFKIYLLKDSFDYTSEGIYQNHCVGDYHSFMDSNIISIRKGSIRMTCEFNMNYSYCKQSRMYGNQDPNTEWSKVLELLQERLTEMRKNKELFSKEFIKFDKDKQLSQHQKLVENVTDKTIEEHKLPTVNFHDIELDVDFPY